MKKIFNVIVMCSVVTFFACKEKAEKVATSEFPIMEVKAGDTEMTEAYSASIHGRQDVDVMPQVDGKIVRLCVSEGQHVKRGQTLFIIDQVAYKAALRKAVADVHSAEAQLATAKLDYESKQTLHDNKVIGDYELKSARNALAVARATLEQARAQEADARNSLGYTEVKSPADGVVGTLPYREGALVGPSMTTALTTVSANETMYAYFSMTENQLRLLIRQYGSPDATIKQMPQISLRLNDGTLYQPKGRIETISGIVNSQTGSVQLRASFPNPEGILFSGGIGDVIIPHEERNVIVIPQSATYELQDKIYVFRMMHGKAVATEIKVVPLNDGKTYSVLSGLNAGDVIVSEGVGVIKDGMEIKVKK